MCGIAGYRGSSPPTEKALQTCLKLMEKRGPDAKGIYTFSSRHSHKIRLLHSRLKIIDLDPRSNQPLRRDFWSLVFNGELFNYRELKAERQRDGNRYATEGDSEVFLDVLAQEGWRGLDRCEGMWAFALYNERTDRLLLGRDRFGEKPLYYLRDSSGFYFGSEIKFLQCLVPRKLGVNYSHLRRYLVNGYRALYKTTDTFYEGVKELPPGSVMEIDSSGQLVIHPYWTLPLAVDESLTYATAVRGVRERLLRSVEWRLRADVPTAFCLSGGVDSNALISVAKKGLKRDVHAFSIHTPDARYEETKHVQKSAKTLGVEVTHVTMRKEDFFSGLKNMVRAHDGPLATISYYTHFHLMEKIAKEGFRVAISGTGGDELFAGYYDHHLAYLFEMRQRPQARAVALSHWKSKILPHVRNKDFKDPHLFVRDPLYRDYLYAGAAEFGALLCDPWREPFREEFYSKDMLRNRMMNELFSEVVPVILHEDDHNAMAFSVENRSPFLDRNLAEFAFTIPTPFLIRKGLGKAVLRDAVKEWVPPFILANPRKVGFNFPIDSVVDRHSEETHRQVFRDRPIFSLIRRGGMERLFQKNKISSEEEKFIFRFLNSMYFLDHVLGETSCAG